MNALLAAVLILTAISALGVVFSPQTIYSALSLVLTVGLLAVVFRCQRPVPLRGAADRLRRGGDGALRLHHRPARPRLRGAPPDHRSPAPARGAGHRRDLHRGLHRGPQRGHLRDLLHHQVTTCMHGYAVGSLAATGALGADPYSTFGFTQNAVNHVGNVQGAGQPALPHLRAALRDHLAAAPGGGDRGGLPHPPHSHRDSAGTRGSRRAGSADLMESAEPPAPWPPRAPGRGGGGATRCSPAIFPGSC